MSKTKLSEWSWLWAPLAAVVALIYGYGMLNARVGSVISEHDELDKRVKSIIESRLPQVEKDIEVSTEVEKTKYAYLEERLNGLEEEVESLKGDIE